MARDLRFQPPPATWLGFFSSPAPSSIAASCSSALAFAWLLTLGLWSVLPSPVKIASQPSCQKIFDLAGKSRVHGKDKGKQIRFKPGSNVARIFLFDFDLALVQCLVEDGFGVGFGFGRCLYGIGQFVALDDSVMRRSGANDWVR